MKFIISTDGGGFKRTDGGGGFNAVSAFQIYEEDKLVYREAVRLNNRTSNYGEIFAIYRGMKAIYSYLKYSGKDKKAEVYLITDSELCYKSLTQWIEGWLEKSNDLILINSSNKPVINQEVIKMAYIYMLKLESICKFKLCHINSHENIKNIDKLRKKFNKVNKTKFTEDEFEIIFIANYETDKMIKETYNNDTNDTDTEDE